jgi:diadenosine tetraphosphate (Ap4A) HIT family hydrolase
MIQVGLPDVLRSARKDVTELRDDEAIRYWQELLTVGRALEEVLQPIKLNYNLLGNSVPHLHAHIVPRYQDDPRLSRTGKAGQVLDGSDALHDAGGASDCGG